MADNNILNNSYVVGIGGRNLVLNTFGRVYVKVQDKYYELDFKSQNKGKSGSEILIINSKNDINTLSYPGDNNFILSKDGFFYYTEGGKFIPFEVNSDGINLTNPKIIGTITIDSRDNAPFVINTSTLVKNLNVEYLNGYSSEDFGVLSENELVTGQWTFTQDIFAQSRIFGNNAVLDFENGNLIVNNLTVKNGINAPGLDISYFEIDDDNHLYAKEGRGIYSDNFISCKGLDPLSFGTFGYATEAFVSQSIAELVGAAPETLDTLEEIANAISENQGVLDVLNQSITNNTNAIAVLNSYFTDGAAKYAIQLKNSRYIWGQAFNGTSNVSGHMYNVGNINFSNGQILTPTASGYLHLNEGFVSDKFISCKGLDATSAQANVGITRSDLFDILQNDPNGEEFINLKYLDLTDYATINWVNTTFALQTALNDYVLKTTYNAAITEINNTKANKSITLTAGNGLIGGGTLEANRTFTLGKPSIINVDSENTVSTESHTHEVAKASTTVTGIVKLYDALNSDSTILALTAKQGKVIGTRLTSLEDMWENKDTYLLAKNNRGVVSNSFISCSGLDTSAVQSGGAFDRGVLFDVLSGDPQSGESINLGYLDLSTYDTELESINDEINIINGYFTNGAANKVKSVLRFGDKSYNGSSEQTITAGDLGALTSHQRIYKLSFVAGSFTEGDFTANSAAKTINIPTTTNHISEGDNLYFTKQRTLDALANATIDGNLTVNGNLITKTKLYIYKYVDDVLQGGIHGWIDSSSNSGSLSYVSAGDSSVLSQADFHINNWTGGSLFIYTNNTLEDKLVEIIRFDKESGSTRCSLHRDNIILNSSVDRSWRCLTGDLGGYCEVSGLNFAITSKEVSYKDMTGVTFDWDKTVNTLKLNKIQYDESELAKKTSFILDINGRLNVLTIGDSLTKITFNNASVIETDGDNLKSNRGFSTDSFLSCKGLDASAAETGGGISEETDPIFTASAAYNIKASDITNWNSKTSNVGTITGIMMNGESKGTSGVVNLGTVITAHQTIYAWAKAATKPTYTKSEVGLDNVTNLAASDYLTALSSNATNAVSITVGGTTKSITVATLKTSLGLGSLAYKNSLIARDIPDLSGSYMSIDLGGIPMSTTNNLNRVGYGYVDGGWLYSGPAIAFGSSNGYTALLQQKAGDYELRVSYKNNGVASGSWKTIAFTSDLEGYLPLSGGTLDGSLTVKGNISASGAITATGNITSSGDIIAFNSSDARLKENITTISDDRAIDILSRLNPVTFAWNEIATSLSSRLQGDSQGFIAQEWEKIIPNASGTMWGKYKGIDYIQAIPYLTKGWQIHETKIERLEREVKELKNKLAKYESIN